MELSIHHIEPSSYHHHHHVKNDHYGFYFKNFRFKPFNENFKKIEILQEAENCMYLYVCK